MKKKSIVLALSLLMISLSLPTYSVKTTENLNAYTIDGGDKKFSIVGDRKIYRTKKSIDQTINTFETWINLPKNLANNVPGGVIFGNIDIEDGRGTEGSCDFRVAKNGYFEIAWNNASYVYQFKNADLRTGEWTHIALVRDPDAGTLTYYVNGEVNEVVNVNLGEAVSHMVYGIGSNWYNWFDPKIPFFGKIRQITLYSKPITESEIERDMNYNRISKSDRPNMGLMSNWYFTDSWGVAKNIYDDAYNVDLERATYDCYVEPEEYEDYDYSFVIVPDIQAMTHAHADTAATWIPNYRRDNFSEQTDWIVENKEDLNIQFVMYLGDLIEDRYSVDAQKEDVAEEWAHVKENFEKLDDVVPYTFVLGNHDYDNWCTENRDVTQFDATLPIEKYKEMYYFGGSFSETTMANTYHFVNVGEVEYLLFALEYRPRQRVINWADQIISAYPNKRVIITSHAIVYPDGTFDTGTLSHDPTSHSGQAIWDDLLSKHSNIFMSFSGHHCTDEIVRRTDIGDNGNKVFNTLIDLQGAQMTACMNTLLVVKVNEKKKEMHFSFFTPENGLVYNEQSQYSFSFADPNNPTVGGVE